MIATKDNVFDKTFLRRADEPLRFAARKLNKFRSEYCVIRTLDPVKAAKSIVFIHN